MRSPSGSASQFSLNALREDLEVSHRASPIWMEVLERLYHCLAVPFCHPERDLRYDGCRRSTSGTPASCRGGRRREPGCAAPAQALHALRTGRGTMSGLHYLPRTGQVVQWISSSTFKGRPGSPGGQERLGESIDPFLRHFGSGSAFPGCIKSTSWVMRISRRTVSAASRRTVPGCTHLSRTWTRFSSPPPPRIAYIGTVRIGEGERCFSTRVRDRNRPESLRSGSVRRPADDRVRRDAHPVRRIVGRKQIHGVCGGGNSSHFPRRVPGDPRPRPRSRISRVRSLRKKGLPMRPARRSRCRNWAKTEMSPRPRPPKVTGRRASSEWMFSKHRGRPVSAR